MMYPLSQMVENKMIKWKQNKNLKIQYNLFLVQTRFIQDETTQNLRLKKKVVKDQVWKLIRQSN